MTVEKKKNVGLVLPGFSADEADWCIPALRDFVGALGRRDEVRVLALRYPHRRRRYAAFGAEVTALGGADRGGRDSLRLWGDAMRALGDMHREKAFDVLHAFWATEAGAIAACAARRLGVPCVVSFAGGEVVGLRDIGYGGQLTAGERARVLVSMRLASRLTAGSVYQAGLAARLGAREVRFAPLGVEMGRFFPAEWAESRRVTSPEAESRRFLRSGGSLEEESRGGRLVTVGSLVAVKDHAMLLRALALLPEWVKLTVVGDGPLRGWLEKLARERGVAGRVEFRGALEHDQLPEAYRAADVFVLSSRHEAQGMVALEAAACGVPVVGTAVGVLPQLGQCVSVGDHHHLARTLMTVLDGERPTSAEMRARVVPEYRLEQSVERFRSLYQEVAK